MNDLNASKDHEKPKHRMISINDRDRKSLLSLSPRNELSDGIRIALKESIKYRKLIYNIEQVKNEVV